MRRDVMYRHLGRGWGDSLGCIFQCHIAFEMPSLLAWSKLAFQGPGVSLREVVWSSVDLPALSLALISFISRAGDLYL